METGDTSIGFFHHPRISVSLVNLRQTHEIWSLFQVVSIHISSDRSSIGLLQREIYCHHQSLHGVDCSWYRYGSVLVMEASELCCHRCWCPPPWSPRSRLVDWSSSSTWWRCPAGRTPRTRSPCTASALSNGSPVLETQRQKQQEVTTENRSQAVSYG